MSSGKVLISLVAGAAAGAVLGIFLAPEKGSITRKNISQKGEDILGNIKTKCEDFLAKATSEVEYVKSETEDLLNKGKAKAQKTKNDLNNIADPL